MRSEAHGQSRRNRDIVPRLAVADGRERLDARHVVAAFDTKADAAEAELTTERAVSIEVGLRIHVEIAIVVRAPTETETHERREVPGSAIDPRRSAQLRTQVILIDVERLV